MEKRPKIFCPKILYGKFIRSKYLALDIACLSCGNDNNEDFVQVLPVGSTFFQTMVNSLTKTTKIVMIAIGMQNKLLITEVCFYLIQG